jgi:hypothetical protein
MPLKKIYDLIFFFIRQQRHFLHKNHVLLVGTNLTSENIDNIKIKLAFYCPGVQLTIKTPIRAFFSLSPVLIFGQPFLICAKLDKLRVGIYNVDYRTNPIDGWVWCDLTEFCSTFKNNVNLSKQRFTEYVRMLKQENLKKCYLFGTGPSLERAIEKNWSDGYRIVCNTIVRDQDLWNHINPNFIVAGDAIYHFGSDFYAKAFRKDLAKRLRETNTFFIYPENFNAIVQREFSEFSERLIPIPRGQHTWAHIDLTNIFSLPVLENVLPFLLIPVGCSLSKNIYLWGFDGRAPTDSLFWSNSKKDSYPEYMDELKFAHPAFFDHFVPKEDPARYVNTVHGDILEQCLSNAERDGFHFVMMHDSWTPTLQKRKS